MASLTIQIGGSGSAIALARRLPACCVGLLRAPVLERRSAFSFAPVEAVLGSIDNVSSLDLKAGVLCVPPSFSSWEH
jgi:hypothetical protein